jgi:arginyl-tRNA synthetase
MVDGFGDQEDRVVVRSNGEPTYFLADSAYHHDKFGRGFQRLIDFLGPDHHGHITRMQGVLEALGWPKDRFEVILIQWVRLLRGGEVVKMSKRAGDFVTLDELVDEVGADAARFFFLMRRAESPMDFDIDLALKRSEDNPVYYVQYAHARIARLGTRASEVSDPNPRAPPGRAAGAPEQRRCGPGVFTFAALAKSLRPPRIKELRRGHCFYGGGNSSRKIPDGTGCV